VCGPARYKSLSESVPAGCRATRDRRRPHGSTDELNVQPGCHLLQPAGGQSAHCCGPKLTDAIVFPGHGPSTPWRVIFAANGALGRSNLGAYHPPLARANCRGAPAGANSLERCYGRAPQAGQQAGLSESAALYRASNSRRHVGEPLESLESRLGEPRPHGRRPRSGGAPRLCNCWR
jgi:hypothetical protein